MDDTFTLYDLKVEVVAGDRPMVCSHKVGDYFRYRRKPGVSEGNIVSMYSLSAILPLLPAKRTAIDRTTGCSPTRRSPARSGTAGRDLRSQESESGSRVMGSARVVPLVRPDAGKYHEN